jgi:uncharacterized protein YuzE
MHVSTRSLQIDYDGESDTLYLHSGKEKAAGSIDFGSTILDYSKKGEAIGIEFLNATKTITPLLLVSPKEIYADKKTLKAEWLNKITKASISAHTEANFLIITFELRYNRQEATGKVGLPLAAPKALEKALIRAH